MSSCIDSHRICFPLRSVWTAPSPGFVACLPSLCCLQLRRRKMKKMKGWMKVWRRQPKRRKKGRVITKWPGRMLSRWNSLSLLFYFVIVVYFKTKFLSVLPVCVSGSIKNEAAPQATLHARGNPTISSSGPGCSRCSHSHRKTLLLICHPGNFSNGNSSTHKW